MAEQALSFVEVAARCPAPESHQAGLRVGEQHGDTSVQGTLGDLDLRNSLTCYV
jgi:hypothetical protein